MMKSGRINSGRKDLVDAVKDGEVALGDLPEAEQPAELVGKSEAEQKAWLDARAARRAELQAQVTKLVAERDAWIAAENKRLAASGEADGFDHKLREGVIEKLEALEYVSY